MSNIQICYGNVIDSATLTAIGQSAQLPVENLKTISRGQVFRCNPPRQVITGVLPVAQMLGMIAIWCPKVDWSIGNFDAYFYHVTIGSRFKTI